MTSPYLPLNDPIRDKDGTIVGAMNFFHDITEQRNAEQASGLLAAIVDSSDDAIISKNLDGVIMSWNKGAERIFGHLAEDAVGKHITLIIPKDRHEEETNILERLRRGERVDHFETVRIRKDGQFVDVSITISPIKDAHGRIIGASKVARDITERKRTEQALEERARLLDLSSDAIMVRDRADCVTYWNRSASELYGFSREEAMGRVTHELLRTEFAEPLERVNEKLHRGWPLEWRTPSQMQRRPPDRGRQSLGARSGPRRELHVYSRNEQRYHPAETGRNRITRERRAAPYIS